MKIITICLIFLGLIDILLFLCMTITECDRKSFHYTRCGIAGILVVILIVVGIIALLTESNPLFKSGGISLSEFLYMTAGMILIYSMFFFDRVSIVIKHREEEHLNQSIVCCNDILKQISSILELKHEMKLELDIECIQKLDKISNIVKTNITEETFYYISDNFFKIDVILKEFVHLLEEYKKLPQKEQELSIESSLYKNSITDFQDFISKVDLDNNTLENNTFIESVIKFRNDVN